MIPENIKKPSGGISEAVLSSVAPGSTTAELAGGVPKEDPSSPPGAFPETPATEAQEFSVKPIPASAGTGNPITLAPGEKVPEPTGNQFYSAVTSSKEDYENAGSGAAPVGAAGVNDASTADKEYSLPDRTANMIPESSLPIESTQPTIQSAGAGTTTAALAGEVPLEPKREAKVLDDYSTPAATVPPVVQESIAESNQSPEAAASSNAVGEKSAVESELLKEVKPTDATGESAPTTTLTEGSTAGAATVGASAADATTTDETPAEKATTSTVPEVVKESITESHQSPEATSNKEAVAEKSAVETELLGKVKTTDEAGEPAPTAAAETSTTAPAPTQASETPVVTTGVDSAKTEQTSTPTKSATSSTPATPESANGDDKKKKRRSGFFGKLFHKSK